MSNPTPEEVRASIVPKSDQLNADDLLTGPLTVTIESVSKGDREQPIIVGISGHRPYKPCKSVRRILISIFGDNPKNWIGQKMTLFCDPDVTWAGVRVGGIRVSHLSGIDKPKTLLLTQTRGKKAEVLILPIGLSDEEKESIEEIKTEIAAVDTLEKLKAVAFVVKNSSKAIQDAVRDCYAKRQAELKDFSKPNTGETK
jgi:hypothetical protein